MALKLPTVALNDDPPVEAIGTSEPFEISAVAVKGAEPPEIVTRRDVSFGPMAHGTALIESGL